MGSAMSVTLSVTRLFNLALLLTIATQLTCPNTMAGLAFVLYIMLLMLMPKIITRTFRIDSLTNYFSSKPPGGAITELLATCALFYTSYAIGPSGTIYSLLPFLGLWLYLMYIYAKETWTDPWYLRRVTTVKCDIDDVHARNAQFLKDYELHRNDD